MESNTPVIELETSPEYTKQMQSDALYDVWQGLPPQNPLCPIYMMAYNSIEK